MASENETTPNDEQADSSVDTAQATTTEQPAAADATRSNTNPSDSEKDPKDLKDKGVDDGDDTDTDANDTDEETGASPVGSFGLIFQVPDPTAVTASRRSRRRDEDDDLDDSDDGDDSDGTDDADDTDSEEPTSRSSRRRRGRRGTRGSRRSGRDSGSEDNDRDDPDDSNDSDDESDDNESQDDDAQDRDESRPTRRRRRGGRGRRRSLQNRDDSDDASDDDSDDEDESQDDDAQESRSSRRRRRGGSGRSSGSDKGSEKDSRRDDRVGKDDEDDSDNGEADRTSRKRTRRRRRAGSGESTQDDPPGTTTRVRQSRRDEATGIKGSTRLEAKRQRRRDGREAGRRRTIITEAQFLARRESVERVMAIREIDGRTEIGVLEDGVLVEHYLSGADGSSGGSAGASSVGNVYLGRVQNVLPSMEAAFVDIGKARNGVLYAGEVNWDAAGLEGGNQRRIENALSSGQNVLVQVTKDPIGHKGARLTSQVSLPGRFLVYVPDGSMTGISRKLPDTERARLKTLLKKIVPDNAGVIVRTAAEGATEEELTSDIKRLERQWEKIQKKAKGGSGPLLLHGEPGLTVRVVRDVFNEDFSKLVVAGNDAWNTVSEYVEDVAPDLADRTSKWTEKADLFSTYRIDEQLAKAMDRKVWLPSGGSLIIERTEAMTVIDVNTGKFTGSGGNLEETVTKNNLEAAEEIVNQLRLRDIGGIIVIDFIDMVLESNRELVVRRLVECLGRDRTKHQVAEVTSLGLVQMTRKRVGAGLIEVFSETCDHCHGRGIIVRDTPVLPSGESDNDRGRGRRGRGRKDNGNRGHDRDHGRDRDNDKQSRNQEDNDRNAVSAAAMAKVAAALKSVPADVAEEQAAEEKAAEQSDDTSTDGTDSKESQGSGRKRGSRRAVSTVTAPSEGEVIEVPVEHKPAGEPVDSAEVELGDSDNTDNTGDTDNTGNTDNAATGDDGENAADVPGAATSDSEQPADAPGTKKPSLTDDAEEVTDGSDTPEKTGQDEPGSDEASDAEADDNQGGDNRDDKQADADTEEAAEASASDEAGEADGADDKTEQPAPTRRRRAGRRAASAPAGGVSLEGVGLMSAEESPSTTSAPVTSLAMNSAPDEDAVVSGTADTDSIGATSSRRPRRRAGSPAGPPTDE